MSELPRVAMPHDNAINYQQKNKKITSISSLLLLKTLKIHFGGLLFFVREEVLNVFLAVIARYLRESKAIQLAHENN